MYYIPVIRDITNNDLIKELQIEKKMHTHTKHTHTAETDFF